MRPREPSAWADLEDEEDEDEEPTPAAPPAAPASRLPEPDDPEDDGSGLPYEPDWGDPPEPIPSG